LRFGFGNIPLQPDRIFVAKGEEQCLDGGFVSWMHNQALRQALEEIEEEHYYGRPI
jgi:hypothetical protein